MPYGPLAEPNPFGHLQVLPLTSVSITSSLLGSGRPGYLHSRIAIYIRISITKTRGRTFLQVHHTPYCELTAH